MRHNYRSRHSIKSYSRVASILLISTGILVMLAVGGMKLYTAQQQKALIKACESVSKSTENDKPAEPGTQTLISQSKEIIELSEPINNDRHNTNGKQNTDLPICLIEIPKIDLTVAVVEGIDNLSLRYAVGHSTDTAMPGQSGNFSVFGHRNYVFGEFFNRLDEIEAGDSILVTQGENNYTYIVTDVFIVEPEETWVLDPTPDAQITLVTCTPVRIATLRLIVKGVLKT